MSYRLQDSCKRGTVVHVAFVVVCCCYCCCWCFVLACAILLITKSKNSNFLFSEKLFVLNTHSKVIKPDKQTCVYTLHKQTNFQIYLNWSWLQSPYCMKMPLVQLFAFRYLWSFPTKYFTALPHNTYDTLLIRHEIKYK